MTSEELLEKYGERSKKILEAIAEALRSCDQGWKVSDICEMHDAEYTWSVLVSKTDDEEICDDDIDITFQILESEHNDGEKNGINFCVSVVTVGGSVIGGLTPYNYTDQVWVSRDEPGAIEERFQILEQADPSGVVSLLESRA